MVLSVHLSLFSTVDKRTRRRRKSVDPWRALVREIIKRCRMIGSFQVQKTRLYEKDHQVSEGSRLISHAPIPRFCDGFRAIFNQAVRIKIQSSLQRLAKLYFFFLPVLYLHLLELDRGKNWTIFFKILVKWRLFG